MIFVKIERSFSIRGQATGTASLANNGSELSYLIINPLANGQPFGLAINQFIEPWKEQLRRLNQEVNLVADESSREAEEAAYLVLHETFNPLQGKVEVARTFCFGDSLLSELSIRKRNDGVEKIAFLQSSRRKKQGLELVGENVLVLPDKLVLLRKGRKLEWNGRKIKTLSRK